MHQLVNKQSFDNIKLHGRNVKIIESECVYCEVRTESLYAIQVNLRLKGFNFFFLGGGGRVHSAIC